MFKRNQINKIDISEKNLIKEKVKIKTQIGKERRMECIQSNLIKKHFHKINN